MTKKTLEFEFDPLHSMSEMSEDSPEAVPEPPVFSAYNEATEDWRVGRLAQAWGAASATMRLMSNRYQNHWEGAILEMRDHKGTLQLIWRDEQSRVMFEGVIVGAWEMHGECMASHALAN